LGKVKIQQLGIDNEGKKPSEISYSQTQDIKKNDGGIE